MRWMSDEVLPALLLAPLLSLCILEPQSFTSRERPGTRQLRYCARLAEHAPDTIAFPVWAPLPLARRRPWAEQCPRAACADAPRGRMSLLSAGEYQYRCTTAARMLRVYRPYVVLRFSACLNGTYLPMSPVKTTAAPGIFFCSMRNLRSA